MYERNKINFLFNADIILVGFVLSTLSYSIMSQYSEELSTSYAYPWFENIVNDNIENDYYYLPSKISTYRSKP